MTEKGPAGKKKESVQIKVDWKALDIVHPDAAGIDVGGSEHWVAISPDRDAEPVRCFGCFTADLQEMARWLVEKGVRSVAMQSTGVYWMPVFEVLEQHGLKVYRTRLGAPKAITAMARKLACLFYRLVKHGQQYVDKGNEYYETKYREQQIRALAKRAQKLGVQVLIPQPA